MGEAHKNADVPLDTITRRVDTALAKKLRDVIETMPAMVWIAGTDGTNEFANRHWQEYTGLSREKTEGSGWQEAVHPADLPPPLSLVRGHPLLALPSVPFASRHAD